MSDSGINKFCMQLHKISAEMQKAEYVEEAIQLVRNAAVAAAPGYSGYLKHNIFHDLESDGNAITGTVYTNVSYAYFIEKGTGPRGEANHAGISPEMEPVYKSEPWWIHEDDLDIGVAEMYRWPYMDTPKGRFYKCSGQPARPFMYPALKDREEDVLKILNGGLDEVLRKATK